MFSIVHSINFAGSRRAKIVWPLAVEAVMFTAFICLWLMLVSGTNTFNLCLNKEIWVGALPYRFKTLVCFYQRNKRRRKWGELGDGHMCFLFQRPACYTCLSRSYWGQREEGDWVESGQWELVDIFNFTVRYYLEVVVLLCHAVPYW